LDATGVAETSLVALFAALLAARFSYVLLISEEPFSLRSSMALFRGGLFGYGAIAGAIAAAWLWLRSRRGDIRAWLDVATPGFVLALILIRAGCMFEGCDHGVVAYGGLKRMGWEAHPTQLYEMVGATLLLLVVVIVSPRQRFTGQLAMTALFGHALLRVVVEFWRGDLPRGFLGPAFDPSLALGLSLLLLGAAFAYGPALSFRRGPRRALLSGVLPLGSIFVFWGRPLAASSLQLSQTQWLGLASALVVAWKWQAWRVTSGSLEKSRGS
jgi:prolipoprotein diacylglyceryltransferase